ncbi:MAG TPA: hypothetical protein PKB14_12355 [Rubrivivax sp.]|nr:hypothetical protein [Rubrivivax sp.]
MHMHRLALLLLPAWLALHAAAQVAPDGLRAQVFVDERRNAAANEQHAGYRLQPAAQGLQLQPAADALLQRWKGDAVLGQGPRMAFGREASSWPVFLVLDLSNESARALQVTRAYLDIESSVTDPQPFLQLEPWGAESFALRNHGWGRAENAVLGFAFGAQQALSERFTLELGALGAVQVTPERAMTAVVPALPQLRDEPPPCAAPEQVPDCLARLHGTQPLGRLDDIAYLRRDRVMTRLLGTLSYQWRDAAGGMHTRTQPLNIELQLFRFAVPDRSTAAIGAPAPEQQGFAPVALQLDRSRYRLPLPYRPLLGPGQNQRLQLTLNAPKASRHLFRVVVESSDGRGAATETIDLLYFAPQLDTGDVRSVR